jgi:flagellar biosynthesis GTPase FlhF
MPQSNDGDILKALIMSRGSVDIAIQRLLEDELAAKKELAKTSENIPNDAVQQDGADNKIVVKKSDSDLARELQREFEAEDEEARKKIEEEDQKLAEQLWKDEQAKKQKEKEEKEKEEKEKKDLEQQNKPLAVVNHNENSTSYIIFPIINTHFYRRSREQSRANRRQENCTYILFLPNMEIARIHRPSFMNLRVTVSNFVSQITEQVKFPAYWSDQEEPLQLFNLDANSDEYQSVCDRFMSTMAVNSKVTVTKIERIQNKRYATSSWISCQSVSGFN